MARFFRTGRKYRRTNRKLSKSYIYGNRSAKAQSKQIAALSRKLNYVAKRNKPETQIIYNNFAGEFTNSALALNFGWYHLHPWSNNYSGDDQAAGSVLVDGNFARCAGISVKLISQYSDNWRDTIADVSHDQNAGYRLVVFQRRVRPISVSGEGIQINDIFNTSNDISSDDTNLTLPLSSGVSSVYKILYAKTFTISRYHSTRSHNIYIPGNKCLNFVREVSGSQSSNTVGGDVYVAILTGGLHYDTNYSARIVIAGTIKIAYTDS